MKKVLKMVVGLWLLVVWLNGCQCLNNVDLI